jgi:hypothetical protein
MNREIARHQLARRPALIERSGRDTGRKVQRHDIAPSGRTRDVSLAAAPCRPRIADLLRFCPL